MMTAGWILTQSSTLLLAGLGAAVLAVRPRSRTSVAFGAYAITTAFGILATNLAEAGFEPEAAYALAAVLKVGAGASLLLVLGWFPRPLGPRGLVALWGLSVVVLLVFADPWTVGIGGLMDEIARTGAALLAPLLVGGVHLALRFRRAIEPREKAQHALMAAGIMPYAGVTVGIYAFDDLSAFWWRPTTLTFALVAVATTLWLLNTTRQGEATRAARNVALLMVASILVGMIADSWKTTTVDDTGVYGLTRILSFAILAYAIVRYQLLGIDVKIRWGISRGTVAAAFVAAFFLASEGAQILLGQGNEWVGLLAAGALVFALAPLQRAAERLAEKAVPVATSTLRTAPPAASDKEEAYKRAVRFALRAGITRAEEVHLHEVAEHMGIGAGRAMALRLEIEQEMGVP